MITISEQDKNYFNNHFKGINKLRFKDFADRNYKEKNECLYIIKDENKTILYIGISRWNIWSRWFGNYKCHFMENGDGRYRAISNIAGEIVRHLPKSMDWIIELWGRVDCAEYCLPIIKSEYSIFPVAKLSALELAVIWDEEDFEGLMIKYMKPKINIIGNCQ